MQMLNKGSLQVWLQSPLKFRIVFISLFLMTIIVNDYFLASITFIPLYHLTTLMLGVAFWNKSKWYLLIFSGFLCLFRWTLPPEHFPGLIVFLSHWFTYFLMANITAALTLKYLKAKEASLELIFALAKSLDSRDAYTAFHSENVARYGLTIAQKMNLSKRQCEAIYIGGLLHDIGKIGIPEHILTKNSRLTESEYQSIKQHPVIGYEMLKHIKDFKENGVLDMILYHHERYDGNGYPKGLKGSEIPLAARILTVADSFDAMTSLRSYREDHEFSFAVNEIRKNKGTQFDVTVADVFLEILEKEGASILLERDRAVQNSSR